MAPPQPELYIGAQAILGMSEEDMYHGWLRKKMSGSKFMSMLVGTWRQVYVVVRKGCMYYFSSESAKKPAGCFSLFGWTRVVRAGDVAHTEAVWAFKILQPDEGHKPYYFSAASEKDMRKWMKFIKGEMEYANGVVPRRSRRSPTSSSVSPEDRDSGSYSEEGSDTYTTIEEVILPLHGATRRQLEDLAEFSSDEDDYLEPYDDTETNPVQRTPSLLERVKRFNEASKRDIKPPLFAKPPAEMKGRRKPLPTPPGYDAEDTAQKRPPVFPKTFNKGAGLLAQAAAAAAAGERGKETEQRSASPVQGASSRVGGRTPMKKPVKIPEKTPVKETQTLDKEDNRSCVESSYIHMGGEEKSEEESTDDYWSCVYWGGVDKQVVHSCLRALGEDGVFCVRDGLEGRQTLDVYHQGSIVKYKIVNKENPPRFALIANQDFSTLEEMLYHYHLNDLPTRALKLKQPYLLGR